MDTISQENESSFSWLPVLALIVGGIAGVLGAVALMKVADVRKSLADQSAITARIDAMEQEVRKTATNAESVSSRIAKLTTDTQGAFNKFGEVVGQLNTEVATLKESASRPAPQPAATGGGSGAAAPVAGPGEYVVKSGDTGSKIARAAGVSLSDLLAVNAGVDWNRLAVGQKIKLPRK